MTKRERAIEAAAKHTGIAARYVQRIIDVYEEAMRQPGPDEVRVRVCVAVNALDDGEPVWFARGHSDDSDKDIPAWIAGEPDGCHAQDQFHWIEANVPAWRLPVEETVEGEVTGQP